MTFRMLKSTALLVFFFVVAIHLSSATENASAKKKYKIAVFAPDISNSQILWNARVSETLVKAGHDVTMIRLRSLGPEPHKVKMDDRIHQKYVDAVNNTVGIDVQAWVKRHAEQNFVDQPFWSSEARETMVTMMTLLKDSCEKVVQDKEFLDWIRDQKFDVAFVHMYDLCCVGIAHVVGIKNWIYLNSGQLRDNAASAVGAPLIPSYMPPMLMAAHEKMTFWERTKSVLGHTMMGIFFPRMVVVPETEIFRRHISPDFPSLIDLVKEAPLVMVNSNELYELARPTLHKIINIGGLGMQKKDVKPLEGEFAETVAKAETVVLMSFGSVLNATLMPQTIKTELMAAFKALPKIQFIMRYDGTDMNSYKPPNVLLTKWMPQTDLLGHPKTKAFISHGGYNSLQETLNAGKPMVAIPVFGDQPKNAKIAERLGIAVVIAEKSNLLRENIVAAIKEVIDNQRYTETAAHLSAIVSKKPVSAEELLVRHTEFLAEFGPLKQFTPYGVHLNWFIYNSYDVYAAAFGILAIVLLVLLKIGCFILRRVKGLCGCSAKEDKTKKE